MTRIHVTDDVITINRSDLPNVTPTHYPAHDPANGVVALDFDGTEVFHNCEDGYEHWLPEQEEYILTEIGALIESRRIAAELGVSAAEKLASDIRGILGDDATAADHVAERLVTLGWKK